MRSLLERIQLGDIDPSFGTPPFGAFYDNPGFNAWALGASFRVVRGLDAFGRITNLFDRDYEEVFGFPALGRAGMPWKPRLPCPHRNAKGRPNAPRRAACFFSAPAP